MATLALSLSDESPRLLKSWFAFASDTERMSLLQSEQDLLQYWDEKTPYPSKANPEKYRYDGYTHMACGLKYTFKIRQIK